MRTFKGAASLDFKVVVPDTFLAELRAAAQDEDASPFYKHVQAKHPVNDDEFLAAVLSNAIRINMRGRLLDLLAEVNLGGTVSPVKIDVLAAAFEHDAPVEAQVLQFKRIGNTIAAELPPQDDTRAVGMSPALAAQYGMGNGHAG